MHIVRYLRAGAARAEVGIQDEAGIRRVNVDTLASLLGLPLDDIRRLVESAADPVADPVRILPPIDGRTEVWACGVTYVRSRQGRTSESVAPSLYDMVYEAERPELFFKSVAWRTVGDGEPIGVRADSELDVPEPELALVVSAHGEIVGYTVCDDVTSRSIEGANPLYLPQAKLFAGSCAVGPGIRPAWEVADPCALGITVDVRRGDQSVWQESTSTSQLRRSPAELVDVLLAADVFPAGAVLSTGTGLVPDLDFSLRTRDVVTIEIEHVGRLSNPVQRGRDAQIRAREEFSEGILA